MNRINFNRIAELTNKNYHTEARIYIAENFDYLGKLRNIFREIKELHKLEGFLNYHLSEYRNEITNEMLDKLSRVEGIDLAEKINSCL